MSNADKQIKDILSKYDEDFASNTWVVPGGKARAIFHKTIERMAAKAGIWFSKPEIISATPDNVVIIVTGRMGDEREEWSFGEASPKNNKNAYPYSMAEKRGKDRVALKLIGLHGLLYSEEEAEEFRQSAPRAGADQAGGEASNRAASPSADPFGLPPLEEPTESQVKLFNDLKARFETCSSVAELDEKVSKAVPETEALTDEQKTRLRKAIRFLREALRPRAVS